MKDFSRQFSPVFLLSFMKERTQTRTGGKSRRELAGLKVQSVAESRTSELRMSRHAQMIANPNDYIPDDIRIMARRVKMLERVHPAHKY